MSALDMQVKRHDELCQVSMLCNENEACDCGADVAAAELAALRARAEKAEQLLRAWVMAEDMMNKAHGFPDDAPAPGSVYDETQKWLERK